jgi:membrane protease YdiL (CAAX protease family)
MNTASTQASLPDTPKARVVSGIELCLGAFLVLAHNVWRIVPNEVPILTAIAILSLRARTHGWNWSLIGIRRPDSWRRVIVVAVAIAAIRHLLGSFVIDPLTEHWWPPANAPAGANEIRGNPVNALIALAVVWSFAAFGEEISYRGYLMTRAMHIWRDSTFGIVLAVAVSSVLFGFGHYYKGPAGIIDSTCAGLLLAAAYFLARRNLWACVLAHGLIDTVSVFALLFGWAD